MRGADRETFLRQACGADVELREEVERLLRAATPTDDFLEQPALRRAVLAEPPRFAAGDQLLDRFRIVRLIGRGGMGEVYEAHDSELGIAVALKTVRASVAVDERAIAKFRSEVRQARSVAHPNVCRVYDLFMATTIDGPVRFLTMELLEGKTLAETLRETGPMSADAAMPTARDVAEALDEAHRQHIVHRDLKPGNIIIVNDGGHTRAVVTDFGLSTRVSDLESRVALSDRLAGTEGYIAPEQRESGAVGPAADIFAFGVLLHEMLTGRTPDEALPMDGVPPRWRKAIAACREHDPQARPQTASDVLTIANGPAWSLTRGAAGAALVLAVLAVALYAPISRLFSARPVEGGTVVLAGIANETSDADLTAITDMFRYQLQQSSVVSALAEDRVADILRQMVSADVPLTPERAREVAWRSGARGIASGRLRGGASGYVLTMRFEERGQRPDVAGSTQVRSFESRDRSELRDTVRAAAKWLRISTGESGSQVAAADRPVEDVTSSSWQAVALFSRAQTLIAASREDDALALLNEAVRLDPDFALAWMRMGDVLMTFRRSEEGYQKWEKALEVFRRRQLSPREEYRIRGMFANDTDDYAEAERVYRLYMLSFPNDFAPYFYIARPLMMVGRTDEAIRMLEEAQKRDPRAYSVPAQLAMFKLRGGRLDDVEPNIAAVRALGQPAWAECLQGQLEFLRGDYAAALKRFDSLAQSENAMLRARAPLMRAAVLADLGRTRAAIDALQEGAALDAKRGDQPARADKLLALAELSLRQGDRRACRDFCIQVEQIDRSPLRLAQAAALVARSGAPADAGRLLAHMRADSKSRKTKADRTRIEGEILLAQGDPTSAWASFQRAAALEAPGILCEYLARGAAAAGETGTAIALYERMATDPGYYWRYPDTDPGRWMESVKTYLALTRSSPTRMTPELTARYLSLVNARLSDGVADMKE